jgi:membrane protein required for colicin V production
MAWGVILDCVVIAVILVSAIIAFLRGFIREVLTILGVGGGLVAAYFIGPSLAPVFLKWIAGAAPEPDAKCLKHMIPCDAVADVMAYGAIFIIVVLVLSIVSHFLSSSAKAVGLGAVDRTFGVVFGVVRGIALLGLLYLPFYLMTDKEDRAKIFEGSTTQVYVEATSTFFAGLIPQDANGEKGRKEQRKLESMAESTRQKMQDMNILGGAPRMSSSGEMVPAAPDGGLQPPPDQSAAPPATLPPGDQAPPPYYPTSPQRETPQGFVPMAPTPAAPQGAYPQQQGGYGND